MDLRACLLFPGPYGAGMRGAAKVMALWGAALVLPMPAEALREAAPSMDARDPCVHRLRMEGQTPVVIHSLEALQAMGNHPGSHYVLGASIDASDTARWNNGAGFVPIGTPSQPFSGTFDGRGHVIHGLRIHRPGESQVGLFGTARNAALCNVSLVGGSIQGAGNVGALVGWQRASDGGAAHISHVLVAVPVRGAADNVGGLVGHHDASQGTAMISHADAAGPVAGMDNVGGLVGHSEAYRGTARILIAHASALVTGAGSNVGGLVGHNEAYRGTAGISDAYATGAVSGRDYVGGLVGYHDALEGRAQIARAYASGAVTASGAIVGGLVGMHAAGGVARSYYATTDAAGQPINLRAGGDAAGEGKTRQQLQQRSTFVGWSMGDCNASTSAGPSWCIHEGHSTPFLRGVKAVPFTPPPGP